MPNAVDLRVYALLDPQRLGAWDLADLAGRVVAGGATVVQLRDKLGTTRQMVERARAIKAALRTSGVPLLVNDRADVARAAEADGVHLGWDDMTAEDARRLLGPRAIIGLSVKTAGEAAAAPLEVLDYVCIGGVFATASKDNPDPPIGPEGFRELAATIRARTPGLPLAAIAGIDASNATAILEACADGVAVITALAMSPDPGAVAHALRGLVDEAASRRATPSWAGAGGRGGPT